MNGTLIEQKIEDQRNYRVVFKGKLSDGTNIEDAKINVAKLYKKNTNEISNLFDGKRVIIKKNASISVCKKIKAKFYDAGLECFIETDDINKSKLSTKNEANKVINIEDYLNKEQNNDLNYESIIKALSTGLIGNSEDDLKFLFHQREKYINHPNNIEIGRAIGRLIYDVMPVDERNYIEEYYYKLELSTDIIIAEINNKIRAGELNKAEEMVSSIMPDEDYFKEDAKSKYFCFNNLFESLFFVEIFKPEKEVRYISNFIVDCAMKYAYILFEKEEYDRAIEVLDRGLYYNPIHINLLFEKGEIFKVQKNWEKFKEINDCCINVAYTPTNISRAYRNYGYMYIEKNDFDAAICCYLLSAMFEKNEHANSQLFYISQVKKKNIDHKKYFKKLKKIFDKRSIPYAPSEDVRNIAYGAAQYYENEKKLEEAIYFYQICYALLREDNILDHIESLKNNGQ